MSELVVIVPSRGRPDAARELVKAFEETCRANTRLILAVDGDDPTRDEYPEGTVVVQDSGTMVSALNAAALAVVDVDDAPFAVGFMGDDHRPRTVGWDLWYLHALRRLGTGIVYGDDLLQHEDLPTQCAMTADIIRAWRFMAPPVLRHMYVDNFWRDMGRAGWAIKYMEFVTVEHLHPSAGKAEWTEGHKRVNDSAVLNADREAYERFMATDGPAVLATLRKLCGHDG